MNIKELQENWNELGKVDPLWAILTKPEKFGKKWEIEQFFATGRKEVEEVINYVRQIGIEFDREKALDFGCGVGRLTQALAPYFDEVHGVDIAPSMIKLAKQYNHYKDKCYYHLNDQDNLQLLEDKSFSFIYTNITLQHINPTYSKNYIKEFLRILVPGGLLIFQLPSEQIQDLSLIKKTKKFLYQFELYRQIRLGSRNKIGSKMEMHGIKREEVVKLVEENEGIIANIRTTTGINQWVSLQYFCLKR